MTGGEAMVDGKYQCCMTQKFHGGINRKYGDLTLRTDEKGTLSGSMFPPTFWLNASFSYGKMDGDQFSFTVHFGTPCQQFSMDVKGCADGSALTGTVSSPMGEFVLEGKKYEYE